MKNIEAIYLLNHESIRPNLRVLSIKLRRPDRVMIFILEKSDLYYNNFTIILLF
jgi:hypothetical protein